ncbi:hypothetical protein [Roseospirillum parvum]|uniref:Uncharacterized protein n=1 Tax=Roseospirillum parvum TaxID=83401 RepID=A0A1G8APM0_9PROT|nr:hypothetical protein [Roseospirillum parvum]SDH22918.1 hypothetical protein SAMN05421742_10565 [Roseospirillum parvum]
MSPPTLFPPTLRRAIFAPLALSVGIASLTLSACGAPHLSTVRSAKENLVGREAAVLDRCIGQPLSTHRLTDDAPGHVAVYSSAQARGPDGRLLASPIPEAAAQATACVFQVAVRDGRIVAVNSENRAGWGFGSIKACSAVVRGCAGS